MTELLIDSVRTSADDLRSLCDRLNAAIPDAAPVVLPAVAGVTAKAAVDVAVSPPGRPRLTSAEHPQNAAPS